MERDEINRRFRYHKNHSEQDVSRMETIRAALKTAAMTVYELTPECREQALAITKLEEACFFAIAAIARPPATLET